MNKKIGLIVSMTLFLIIALFSAPLTFAQDSIPWDYCIISAYGTDVIEEQVGTILRTDFIVAVLPSGSNITNTIYVMNYDTGENYTKNLSAGQEVRIRYDDLVPDKFSILAGEDPGHSIIYFEGAVVRVRINTIDVPEFPAFLVIPMFIAATLLALVYRRKRTSQIKQ